jgi:NADH-quinone oxidoreductase subunit L
MDWLRLAPPIVVAAAFVLALLTALAGRRVRVLAPLLSLLAPASVLVVGIVALARQPAGAVAETTGRIAPWLGRIVSSGTLPWFSAEGMQLNVGWAVDSLSAVMLVVVGVVASMVVIFSAGYMSGDKGWARYFALLALFTGSMTLLVIASDFVGLFIGWELVGVCSFLLIGFWFEKPSAMRAATKAFITTRVGDAGMLLGLALLWRATGSLAYSDVFAGIGALSVAALTAAALLLFVGAAGKSAQFPLHIWLPDAMEGPTPVSALIHAATMVAAGVFLIARTWPLFEAATAARGVILGIGVITAFGAATIAVAQRDIKKVLAYSTISQLGYMMSAMGAGAFVVGMFHLVTHAAFKALLFLAAGSVIHGAGTQDLREMGGLRRAMPWTAVTWIVGAAALAGIPPFSGFFSKDEVVSSVWHASTLAGLTLIATSALTAFYVARATRLAFFGERRSAGHVHESPWNMRGPLVVLAVLAAGLGFLEPSFSRVLEHEGMGFEAPILAMSLIVAVGGVALGWLVERRGAIGDESLQSRLGILWRGAAKGWGFDGFVTRFVVEPATAAARITYAFVDRLVIDGAVEGTGGLTRWVGKGLAALQTGDGQWYVTLIGVGVLLLLVATVWMGRLGL